ncbi:NAD-dependent epimerase/dehydratase family protein [Burkholderia thailandensis]|nr:NAD-dependent epimerase/dehydratase family protein [Burkholderia thailandensis]AIP64030.2 NAD-dependent dehydratase [Burkholderia thailandensis]AOI53619.1 NAD(P)-dependent oxidoreductase [Burkholderia thailandensis]AOJ46879.1 NAD(P)-dependent oxidoreductase [Burkholderia thailandensis]AOJ52622.1 NAD(P)-dependent oxidoreductase [Burkholderia thailandensis]KVG14512.1 NAD(P)-dependent oxidoreductase [Burkholderia thailandensis]
MQRVHGGYNAFLRINRYTMIATRILRRPRVLIVGCGDVGMRCAAQLRARHENLRVIALTSRRSRCAELRAAGVVPVVGDLDARATLERIARVAHVVLHLAPPQATGHVDRRTQALVAALASPRRPRQLAPAYGRLRAGRAAARSARPRFQASAIVPDAPSRPVVVYASTSGVYGDCGGARVDETRPVRPANPRAQRRVSAERQLRRATARGALSARIVRIPGIYAANRLPLARLEKGTPALIEADDVYTNHIHADDLASILLRAAARGKPARVVHASDDTELKMGDYFERVARAFGLRSPPRIARAEAERQLEPMLLSFMRESRRLANARMKRELRIALRYPSVDDFLRTMPAPRPVK